MVNSRLIAVIPARGGSKRVPKKNIRSLCGRPVIAYTIEAARHSGLFDRVVVSTDSEEIAAVARSCGAETPFVRTSALADDHTPVSLVTIDAVERLDPAGDRYDAVCQLMANCPLRDAADIAASYRQFAQTASNSQISVAPYGLAQPWWAMELDERFALKPLFEEALRKRSQDLPKLLCPTGAVWWAKTAALRKARSFYLQERTGWELDWRHAVDIDTEEDWSMAEALMNACHSSRAGSPS
jgi:pseudaminic acid cytidylyltransferase